MATFLDPLFSFGERWGTGWDAFATALYTLERDEVLRHAKACSFLRRTGHCVVCAAKKGLKLCLCVLVSCALHVAGPPCTDFSPQGGRQRHWGGTFACTLLWIVQRIQLDEDYWIHENVVQYDNGLLLVLLSPMFVIVSCEIDPLNLGWPASRPRRLTIGINKRLFKQFVAPLSVFVKICSRECALTCFDFFVADTVALSYDLAWSRNRPSSCVKAHNLQHVRTVSEILYAYCLQSEWAMSLGLEDLNFLGGYRQLNRRGRRAIFYLNQDPDTHEQWSRTKNEILPTIIANATLMWCEFPDRSLSRLVCACEMLLFQGFVACDGIASYGESSSFLRHSGCRTRPSMVRQSGNSMNSHVMGLLIVFVVSLVSKIEGVEEVEEELTEFLAGFVKKPRK